jgi:hypothetical protein
VDHLNREQRHTIVENLINSLQFLPPTSMKFFTARPDLGAMRP